MSTDTLLIPVIIVIIAVMLVATAIYFLKQTTGPTGTMRNWGARHYEELSQDDERTDR